MGCPAPVVGPARSRSTTSFPSSPFPGFIYAKAVANVGDRQIEHDGDDPDDVPERDWEQCEILTLHAAAQWHGTGTALIEAVEQLAVQHRCTRLWVITTNDNVDALRFYRRRGFCLVCVHRGAVDHSRASLKPAIPLAGNYGIPLRDELELEKQL